MKALFHKTNNSWVFINAMLFEKGRLLIILCNQVEPFVVTRAEKGSCLL